LASEQKIVRRCPNRLYITTQNQNIQSIGEYSPMRIIQKQVKLCDFFSTLSEEHTKCLIEFYIYRLERLDHLENTPKNLCIKVNMLSALGAGYQYLGHNDDAEKCFIKALDLHLSVEEELKKEWTESLKLIQSIYKEKMPHNEGKALYQKAVTVALNALPKGYPILTIHLSNVASLYKFEPHYDTLEREHLEIQATREHNTATQLMENKKYNKAEKCYLKSLSIWRKIQPARPVEITMVLDNLTLMYKSQGKLDKAQSVLFKKLAILRQELKERDLRIGKCCNEIANIYYEFEQFEDAKLYFFEALTFYMLNFPMGDPSLEKIQTDITNFFIEWNKYKNKSEENCRTLP